MVLVIDMINGAPQFLATPGMTNLPVIEKYTHKYSRAVHAQSNY